MKYIFEAGHEHIGISLIQVHLVRQLQDETCKKTGFQIKIALEAATARNRKISICT